MAETMRVCAKTGCRWPAAASLSYRYHTRQVWLLDLSVQPEPSLYDLCPHHADALTVPNGWASVDDRTVRPAPVEPSAAARADRAEADRAAAGAETTNRSHADLATVGRAGPSGRGGSNRYARLVDDLPRLAAEAAATLPPPRPPSSVPSAAPPHAVQRTVARRGDGPATPPDAVRGPSRAQAVADHPAAGEPPREEPQPRAIPSRDLAPAPLAAPTETWRPPAAPPPPAGQLSIPVDDLDEGDAVVVSISLAGSRRRTREGVNP